MIEPYPKTRESWDDFLKSKYGYQLYQFEKSFLEIQRDEDPTRYYQARDLPEFLKHGNPFERKVLRTKIKIIERLKKHIIKTMSDLYEEMMGLRPDEDFIIKTHELKGFFNSLDEEIIRFETLISRREIPTRKRRDGTVVRVDVRSEGKGHPPETRYQILFVWAEAIRDGTRIDWKMLLELWDWFKDEYYDAVEKFHSAGQVESLFKEEVLEGLKRAYRRAEKNKDRMDKIKDLRIRHFFRYPRRVKIRWTKADAKALAKYQGWKEKDIRRFEKERLESERDFFLKGKSITPV